MLEILQTIQEARRKQRNEPSRVEAGLFPRQKGGDKQSDETSVSYLRRTL